LPVVSDDAVFEWDDNSVAAFEKDSIPFADAKFDKRWEDVETKRLYSKPVASLPGLSSGRRLTLH
jgi:hypothetical protein